MAFRAARGHNGSMRHLLLSAALAAVVSASLSSSVRAVDPPAQPGNQPAAQPPARAPGDAPAAAKAGHALPSDEAGAAKALADSPRHGEWVTISLGPDAGGKVVGLKTWISYPERADKAPVVIVIHEIFGMTDWVRGVADQLAAEGFIAVAPDLLSGKGPNGGATDSLKAVKEGDAVREAIRTLEAPEIVARLDACKAFAETLPSAAPRVACIGFCWGGTTSWTYATRQPALRGAVVYYGTAPEAKESIAAIACPVIGLYGGDDARVTATVEPTTKAMSAAGKAFDPHVFAGAGHGFLRQLAGRDGKNRAAAQEAWDATIAFLKARLEEPAAK